MNYKVVLAAVAGAAYLSLTASAQTGNPGGPINDNLGEMDYGVCRGVNPKCFHDWPRPKTTQYRVLLYTRTGSSRHADLGPLLPPGLNPPLGDRNLVQTQMLKIAAENGWHLDYTEDVTQMANVNSYNAIIFFSTSRDILDDAAKTALRQYIRAGGGFVAIHNAFGTLYNWPYYEGLLGGANFYDHPGGSRPGDVVIVDSKDASTKALPKRWHFQDEWYNLVPFPTHVRFLAIVDEKSIQATPPRDAGAEGFPPPIATNGPSASASDAPSPGASSAPESGARGGRGGAPRLPSVVGVSPGHGSFHPVAWCQYYDGGKVWATTLGHDGRDFADDDTVFPGSVEFKKMIVGGIKSVMGIEPFCR